MAGLLSYRTDYDLDSPSRWLVLFTLDRLVLLTAPSFATRELSRSLLADWIRVMSTYDNNSTVDNSQFSLDLIPIVIPQCYL